MGVKTKRVFEMRWATSSMVLLDHSMEICGWMGGRSLEELSHSVELVSAVKDTVQIS